ncbi:MAG: response regulator [Candidatus Dadabacteria bacterium]|nr:response regulator [Candidatus Dadabacteria bacterium]
MLVEDNDHLRNLYGMYLIMNDFDVVTASDGQDALNVLENYTPEIIILDITMPVIDGLTLLNIIKGTAGLCKIPVIMLTANEDILSKCFEYGASSYINKGSNTCKELVTKISTLVR